MGVKTITISLKAYEALLREKRPGESFSDVILRLIEEKSDLLELAGAWGDVDEEQVEMVMRQVREAWRQWRHP